MQNSCILEHFKKWDSCLVYSFASQYFINVIDIIEKF